MSGLPREQRVGAYLVCVDPASRLLLCRLTAMTGRPGWWTLPGGGEHPEAAAVRELREETGLEGRVLDFLTIHSIAGPVHDDEGIEIELHRIRVVYRAEIVGGELCPETSGSSDRAQWFAPDELDAVPLVELGQLGTEFAWVT